ncbi:MAG: ABC transporter permease [Acidobacteriota bacterium]
MKSAIWPVMRREYLSRFLTKGFWISTALFPLLTVGFTVLPRVLAERTKSSPEAVRIVDTMGDFFPVLQAEIAKNHDSDEGPPIVQEPVAGRNLPELKHQLNVLAEKGKIQGYLIIDSKSIADSDLVYYARNPSSIVSSDSIRRALREAVIRYRLKKLGVSGPQVESAVQRVDFDVQKATNNPKQKESGISALFMSFALVFFLYFTLIFYGVYILRGVLEEKTSRIVEIIVSSVKPFELMLGKILGIGAVGLTQIAIWFLFALIMTVPQIAGVFSITRAAIPSISPLTLTFFPIYFILGYFLYATIYAGIGSMFNSDEDAQQMVSLASLLLVVPMMLIMPVIKNPAGGLAIGLSLFPFFTPILMLLRISVQTPPAWQIALSVVIMIATIVLMIWIVSKIYRVGILMYGKKPTIPELIRWLRYT